MIRASLEDVVIEPQRRRLIPGFQDVQAAALARTARSAARSPAQARRCSPGASTTAPGSATPWWRPSRAMASPADHWVSPMRPAGRAGDRRAVTVRRARAATRCRAAEFGAALRQGTGPRWRAVRARRTGRSCSRRTFAASAGAGRRSPRRLLGPFAAGDRARAASAGDLSREAFNFPAPLVPLAAGIRAAERARAVPRADRRVQGFRRALPRGRARAPARARPPSAADHPRGDLRATPGGAVAAAFHRRPWIEVVGAVPQGSGVPDARSSSSPAGATTSGRYAVRGTFDDCQRLVKAGVPRSRAAARARALVREQHQSRPAAAADGVLRRRRASRSGAATASRPPSSCRAATSATSLACLWARAHGAADRATSCSRTTPTAPCRTTSTAATGSRAPSIATLASAMDVGNPSNMERLRALYPEARRTAHGASAPAASSDEEIRAAHPQRLTTISASSGVRTPPPPPRPSTA